MTSDQYLVQVLNRISAPTGILGPGARVQSNLTPMIQEWAGAQLAGVTLSGSYAKGTSIVGGTDVDLFISLRSNTTSTLKEIYESLATHVRQKGYTPRRQNVSIGIGYSGYQVDLVPGKRQSSYGSDHSLYVSRQNTWTKTNVETHVQTVSRSGHVDVIKLIKYWRTLHRLDFPSFAVELAVLKALDGQWITSISSRVLKVLEFLRDRITSTVLQDPANTNNNVANDMTSAQKQAISTAARNSLGKANWSQIIW